MITLTQALRLTRLAIAQGWGEPFSRTRDGVPCSADDEGVFTLSVWDAIPPALRPEALEAIEAVAVPAYHRFLYADDRDFVQASKAFVAGGCTSLDGWLQDPKRTQRDVVRVLDVAILRSMRGR